MTKATPGVIGLPHLGASTLEAEDNCAIMVAEQVKAYLEEGNIVNSVNFPNVSMPRRTPYRLVVCNENVPNMVGQISTVLASASININDMINRSKGELAYTIIDSDSIIPDEVIARNQGYCLASKSHASFSNSGLMFSTFKQLTNSIITRLIIYILDER